MRFIIAVCVGSLLALIPAFIAQSKGRSFGGFWLYGFFLLPIAIIHAAVMKSEEKGIPEGSIQCPYCAEIIDAQATVCSHCGRNLPSPLLVRSEGDTGQSREQSFGTLHSLPKGTTVYDANGVYLALLPDGSIVVDKDDRKYPSAEEYRRQNNDQSNWVTLREY